MREKNQFRLKNQFPSSDHSNSSMKRENYNLKGQKKLNNSYCHKQRINKQPRIVSLFVDLPVFNDYKNIDLKKTSSYQRINRHKLKSIIQQNKRQCNEILEISNQQQNWKQMIQRYIQVKQKSVNKYQGNGYPLMKLSKKNELLRKIKTNEKAKGKPQIVKELQIEQMFEQKPLSKGKTLPKIIQIKKLQNTQSQKISNKNQLIDYKNSFNLNKEDIDQCQNRQRRNFLKQVVQKAKKDEKVLINFIGNYFRQKFSPQKRYSHQISSKQYNQQLLKLKIQNVFLNHNKQAS